MRRAIKILGLTAWSAAVFLAGVAYHQHTLPRYGGQDREDSAVLSTIMQNRCNYAAAAPDGDREVLAAESRAIEEDHFPDGLDAGAVKSLQLRNKTSSNLPVVNLCPTYLLYSKEEIDTAIAHQAQKARDWWDLFHQAFPSTHGITYLSLPGYSQDGQHALVLVSGGCGRLCGSGHYWALRKVNGQWRVEQSLPAWVS